MRPRTKSSLLWGVIGALSFLVLVQAYQLLGAERVALSVMFGGAILIGIVVSVLTHVTERVLAGS